MFKNLAKYDYERSTKEAIGFYIAYLLLIMIVGGLLGGIFGTIIGDNTFNVGSRVGTVVAIITCVGVSFLIIKEKNLISHFGFVLLALTSGVISIFIGALGGLIPVAYLTTKPAKKN